MPELPEVETIKQELARLIKNKKIKSLEINLAKQVKNPVKFFTQKMKGARIVKVRRRAKILIFGLDNGYHLVFHLKMTGQLVYKGKKKGDKEGRGVEVLAGGGHPIKHDLRNLPNKYSHVIFNFSDGGRLFFNDTRQFGWVKLVNDKELAKIEGSFGPEPLEIRNYQKFVGLFKSRKVAIKPLLMEQKIIAGIGNIYAQEACWRAKILPTRPADKINLAEWRRLFNCLRRVLKLAIQKKGTSADTYVDAFGRQGSMEPYLKVYGRAGEKCLRCGVKLKMIKQAQRTTVYCPKCQR